MSVPVSAPPRIFTILMVCTGNVCRSPIAERLGRGFMDEALGEELASEIRFTSAGTHAVVGSTMHPDSELVLRGLGGDPAKFWAGQLDRSLSARADLTLTMTRAHREAVLELAPRSLARTFTLVEAADLLALVGDVPVDGADMPGRFRTLIGALAGARPRRRASDADDIPDPIGRPLQVHQQVGEQIADALLPILSRFATLAKEPLGERPQQADSLPCGGVDHQVAAHRLTDPAPRRRSSGTWVPAMGRLRRRPRK